ncbi:hypothetical protein DFQ27_000503 [Actinomortierella ambigua]|uniref:IPT/TIG domain-containing protein n=1 Tax=Actinomortierella ambigua TaxID=1343610 RepID=A0A9P6QCK4_9FUNG|nr:hypothetical protein DFQ27_000503 [Actinomortierella ambigua]
MLSSDIPDQQESNGNPASGTASPTTQSARTETQAQAQTQAQARGPQAQRIYSEEDSGSQVPRDAWEDHSGDFPPRITSLSTKTVAIRGGQLVSITGENLREGTRSYRSLNVGSLMMLTCATTVLHPSSIQNACTGGVQVVLICGQFGDGRTSLKVITPRIRTNTELEFESPCLLDWWQQANSNKPTSSLVFQVSLSCSGVVPDPDELSSQVQVVGREDSEVDLLHAVVELHRQVLRNTIQTGSPADDVRTLKRTRTLLELDQPADVSKTEHLALGVLYMLCDSHDQISAKSLHQIMTPFPNGGHDLLHLSTILGLSTLVREICRHLLSHSDPESINAFYARDTNNMTGIQDILEMTLDTAKELGKTVSAYQATSISSNSGPKSNPARPLPKLPSKERPKHKATTMPIKLSPTMLHMALPPGTPPSPVPALPADAAAVVHPTAAAIERPLPPTPPSPTRVDGEGISNAFNVHPTKPPRYHTMQICTSPPMALPSSPPPPLPMPMASHTEIATMAATTTTTAAPAEYSAPPEPMYPPPSTAPTNSYPPPSHPPPLPSHSSQPMPNMPFPVPSSSSSSSSSSGSTLTPAPYDFTTPTPPHDFATPAALPHDFSTPATHDFAHLHPGGGPPPLASSPLPSYPHYGPPPPGSSVGSGGSSAGSSPHVASAPIPAMAMGSHSPAMMMMMAPPVPPPRHKVTKVTRPKDFVIPAVPLVGSSGGGHYQQHLQMQRQGTPPATGGVSKRRQTMAS